MRRFIVNDGFKRMRFNPQQVTLCIDAYYRGMSFFKLQGHLEMFYSKSCHQYTILRWIRKFCTRIGRFVDKLKVGTSKRIQVDEMQFKTKGKESWFIDVIDPQTRFVLASGYFRHRGLKEIRGILQECNRKDKEILAVTTDGYMAYRKVVGKTFRAYQKNVHHTIIQALKGEGFVHKIERLHNSIRERTKIMRGFKALHSAKAIMKGWEIFYNFIRVHQAIKKCPYELALPELVLGKNRWLSLIEMSSA